MILLLLLYIPFLKRPTNGCTPFALSRKPESYIDEVYICLIRSIIEYAVTGWANIPLYLEDVIHLIQNKVLTVIFQGLPYDEALRSTGVTTLTAQRHHICKRFIQIIETSGYLSNLLPNITEVPHGYTLHSGQIRCYTVLANTSRLNNLLLINSND